MSESRDDDKPSPPDPAGKPRPDWLVGADEGLETEFGAERKELPAPKLSRPNAPAGDPHDMPAGRPVPKLTRPGGDSAEPRRRLPDLDDVRHQLSGISQHVEWAPPPQELSQTQAPPAPVEDAAVVTARPSQTPEPQEFYSSFRSTPAEPELPTPRAPAFQQALAAALEAGRRGWKWLAAGTATVLIGVVVANAAGVGTTSLHDILTHPERYDGHPVKVRGRVSQDVFPVGGGYTFYLLRGRDSLVVFTRSRVPVANQSIELQGEVSTGSVAGEDRPALLEQVRPPRH